MMFRCFFVVCALITLGSADIFWPGCETPSDHWGIPEGNLYNLCIIKHEFSDARHSWNLFNATLSDVVFKDSIFVNSPSGPNNFTETSWNNVNFDGCYFGSIDGWQNRIVFERTTLNNVKFSNSIFDHSVRIEFREYAAMNLTFENCTFRGDTLFTLGQMNQVSIIDSRARHTDFSTVTSSNNSFTFRKVSASGVSIVDSTFILPLRFEAAEVTKMSINDTSVNQFACRSEPTGAKDEELLLSSFTDSVFQTVRFVDGVSCDSTTWKTMYMLNATFEDEADFSRSKFENVYWDEIESLVSYGERHTFNVSMSTIETRVIANVSLAGTADFRDTVFEYVYVRSFNAETALFEGATFNNQEYIDGSCCSLACQTLGCFCNVTLPSGNCPAAGRSVNLTAPEHSGACFPEDSTVVASDGNTVSMKDLKTGTNILSSGGTYSPVFMFGHRDTRTWMKVVEIRTSHSNTVRLSPGHYLYVNGGLKPAERVTEGDRLTTDNGKSVTVTKVEMSIGRGMYAPTTLSGSLVVDGILASCYTDVIHPNVAHWLLSPFRWIYRAGMLPHFSLLEERSWSWMARKFGIPRGPNTVLGYGTLTDADVNGCRVHSIKSDLSSVGT